MKPNSDGQLAYLDGNAKALWPTGLTVDDILPLRYEPFGSLKVPVTKNFVEHLNSLYGSDWNEIGYDFGEHKSHTDAPKKRCLIEDYRPLLPEDLEVVKRKF